MATVEKSGIYKDANGDYFQFKAGQEMPDEYVKELEYSEAFPEAGKPLGSKATNGGETKRAAAPENKSA